MKLVKSKYHKIRKDMKPGDIIAFGGNSSLSNIVKWASKGPVSHVAIVIQSKVLTDNTDDKRFINQVIESKSSGVRIRRLSEYIDEYNGDIWWLPLSDYSRNRLKTSSFFNFILKQKGKKYDYKQALDSAIDSLDNVPGLSHLTHNREDFSKFFCSELAVAGLEAGGVIKSINASEVTPLDLCRFNIFSHSYHQISGKTQEINGFNSIDPEHWGFVR